MCCFKTGGALSKETHHTQGKASHQRFVLWPVLGIEVGLKLSGSPTKSSLDVTELISSTSKFMTAVVFYVYLGNCGRDTGARSAEIDLLAHVRRQTAMLLKMWLTNTSILRLSEFGHSVLLEEWFVWLFSRRLQNKSKPSEINRHTMGTRWSKTILKKCIRSWLIKVRNLLEGYWPWSTDLTVGRYDLIWF